MARTLPAIETVATMSEHGWIDTSYDALVGSIGSIVDQEDIGSYQGDILYLIRDGERWGIVCVGYGSCSGCDALQACSTLGDVGQLRDSISNGVRWADDAEGMLELLEDTDWRAQWYSEEEGTKTFIERCKARMIEEGASYNVEELLAASDYLEDTEAQRREGPIAFSKAARALRRLARQYQDKKDV